MIREHISEKEIAMIMTIVKLVEMNREQKIPPMGMNVRFWFDTYLEIIRRDLQPPTPPG